MNQAEFNRAASRATGENVSTIKRLGFQIVEPDHEQAESDLSDLDPYVIDWDTVDFQRHVFQRERTCRESIT